MFTGKLGKIALSLVNMDVLPEIMHDASLADTWA